MFRGRTYMWIIAKTKPNQEKKANINLLNQGLTTFLPIIHRKKFHKNQWVTIKNYLFSGYIFINEGDAHGKYQKINNTYGISKVLIDFETFKPFLLQNHIIEEITDRLKAYHSGKSIISKNDIVEVTSGIHNELKGIFLEDISNKRSKLLINILKSYREVIVNKSDIQLVY